MDISFHYTTLYGIFCPSSTNIKLQTFSNGAETTTLQERSQVLHSVCRKSIERIFHREQDFLKKFTLLQQFQETCQKKILKNCPPRLTTTTQNNFEMVLPGRRTGVTFSCCYHSTTLSLLGRGIPRGRAETCQENVPRVQQWRWTTLQPGLGLKKQHCLRNDWPAFAWGWDGITASKVGLSTNGLPGESAS